MYVPTSITKNGASGSSEEEFMMTKDDEERPKYPEIKMNLKPRTSDFKDNNLECEEEEDEVKTGFFG